MILALAVVVAACAAQADTIAVGDVEAPVAPEERDSGGDPASFAGPEEGAIDVVLDGETAPGDRRVIRQASMQLHASDTREAFQDIVALTESIGGFVSSANVSPVTGEDREPDIAITLRVPAAELTATMRAIQGVVDEVVSESQDAQDVSAQFVDLEARLTNLRALETELRQLLAEVRDNPGADPEKLLRVFTELGNVRGQIEQIQGQIDYLADLTDLATLQVGLTQTPAAVPIVEQPWAPGEAVNQAARNLVTAMQSLADWAITFAIYTLPILVIALAIPGLVAYLAYRRWWKGRGKGGSGTPTPAEA
jgi:hypothetical protein